MKLSIETLLKTWSGDGYSDNDASAKHRFHRLATKRLREVAAIMGLAPGSFEVRSNKGGMAVSGEVTLHSESIYAQALHFGEPRILFRTCNGRKDYTGGANHYMPLRLLDDPAAVAAKLTALVRS